MGLRWFCFIFILIQFIVWCRGSNSKDSKEGAGYWIGAIIGTVIALIGWVGTLWFVLLSQFI